MTRSGVKPMPPILEPPADSNLPIVICTADSSARRMMA
eukprot:CAMPEP_0180243758 /NCGR_PEP_ID=MMETSP0987-20121128/34018_1 /TAXON_ID=697907 /ORGANISM="non described non described, Strain CCMP2293" /LENGTH=37 /DNA_ID= /DNA_START= /DNA_END= /DNA_ORIENTATION=